MNEKNKKFLRNYLNYNDFIFLKVKSVEHNLDVFVVCDDVTRITTVDINEYIVSFDDDLSNIEVYDPEKTIFVVSDKISHEPQECYMLYKFNGWLGYRESTAVDYKYYEVYFVVSKSNLFEQFIDFFNIDINGFSKYDSNKECYVETTIYEILNNLKPVSRAILFKSKKFLQDTNNNDELVDVEQCIN